MSKEGTVPYYKDGKMHNLNDALVCVDCKQKFEHTEVEIANGEFMKEVMRLIFPHPNRVYATELSHHEIKRILDEAEKELREILNKPILRDGSPSKVVLITRWKKKWMPDNK